MANVRVFSYYVLGIFLLFHVIAAKPMFGLLYSWCLLTCDDDSTNPNDYDPICDCGPRPRNRVQIKMENISSPLNGCNVTMSRKNGVWRTNVHMPCTATIQQLPRIPALPQLPQLPQITVLPQLPQIPALPQLPPLPQVPQIPLNQITAG